jgi:hypothetical protein
MKKTCYSSNMGSKLSEHALETFNGTQVGVVAVFLSWSSLVQLTLLHS